LSLTGRVPSGLNDSLSQLTILNLYNNYLSGPTPPSSDKCTSATTTSPPSLMVAFMLSKIFIFLTTTSPPSNLTNLEALYLANNTNLPPWTFPFDLTHSSLKLSYLDLKATNLMGSLPNLSHFFPDLYLVSLSNNHLSFIPQGCFQGLPSLLRLNLGNNTNLAPWTFPNVTHSTQLKELNLVATNVTGFLPADILKSLPNLQTILLSNNHLTGVSPESFGGSKVVTLRLNDNGFSGTIDVLSNMVDLSEAWLQGNSFEGPIPDLSRSTALLDLQLAHNLLTGIVPDSLTTLDSLQSISLNDNFLQGPLPQFAIYPEENVNLGVNTSNGFCHKNFGPCDHKVTILLEIAAEFGYPILLPRSWRGNNACKNWSFITCDDKNKIRIVNLSNLKLTGTISPAFANLTDLRKLYLDDNNLTGEIPQRLTTLPKFEVVNVSNNHLSGNIPKFSPKVNFIATGNDFHSGSDHRISIPLIIGLSAASVGIFVTCVVVIYKRKRLWKIMFKKTIVDHNVENLIQSDGFMMQKRYNLSDGRQVAVKILKESKNNGEEFINEVASINRTFHLKYAQRSKALYLYSAQEERGVSRISRKSDVYSYGKLILE
ncbi:hypothetical protein S245_048738, partial [Arachis hypogaea]